MTIDITDEEVTIICGLLADAVLEANYEIAQHGKQKFKAIDTKQYERIEAEEDRAENKRFELLELWQKIESMKVAAEEALKEKEND